MKARQFSLCAHCEASLLPHRICQNCGYYKNRQVLDVLTKLDKKERKKKEKELHEHEENQAKKEKVLSAEELSRR